MDAAQANLLTDILDTELAIREILLNDGVKLFHKLLITIFQMRIGNFQLCLRSTLEKMLQKLALLQQILYTCQEYLAVEWLGDVGIGTMFITFGTMLFQILRRKHNDRDMRGCRMGLQILRKLQTIHHRHHHITDHQVRNFLLGNIQSFLTISSFQNDIIILQKGMLILTDIIVVIDNQDGWLIRMFAQQLLYFSTFSLSIVDILQFRLTYQRLTF